MFWVCEAFDVVDIVIEEGIELAVACLNQNSIGLLGATFTSARELRTERITSLRASTPAAASSFQTLDEHWVFRRHDRSFRDLAKISSVTNGMIG